MGPWPLSVQPLMAVCRVSGPLGRSFTALVNELGADPYTADDAKAALLQAEAMLKSNDARVRVDWKGPVEMLDLADGSLSQMLQDVSAFPIVIPPGNTGHSAAPSDSCGVTAAAGPFRCANSAGQGCGL